MKDDQIQFQLAGTSQKLTDWASEPDIFTLKGDLESARSSHDSQLAKINRWIELRNVEGAAKPKKIQGRSSVQPKLIRRQAEWRYSALSEPFLSSDKLFTVNPVTFEDDAAAKQNELVLNYQFRTKVNRVKLIDDLVQATVDEGTSIVRLGWCRYTTPMTSLVPVFEHYPIENEEQLLLLQQALELRTSNPRMYNEQVDASIKASVEYYDEHGIPTIAIQVGQQEVTEEKIVENRPTVEVMDPANVYIDPSCGGDINKALFAIVSFETNRAELLKEGDRYRNLDMVNWEGNTPLSQPDHETRTPDDFQFKDATRKKVVAYEYWGFYDIEGNGVLEPIVATWIGDTIIRMEKNPFPDGKLPFVVIPYLPVKRELYGESDAEMLEDNQKILGAVARGMIDLLGRSANGQMGTAKGMLDPLNRRRFENGLDYEFNPNMPPNVGIIEHKYPEIPQSAMLMLNLQNQEAEALTGVKSFSGGLSGEAYGKVATGIRGMLDAASKREMSILRRIAKGIADIGKKIIAMNSEFLSDVEVIRVTNKEFVSIKREDLKGDFDLAVDISTFEVDNEKAQDLGFMLQTLGPNMDPRIAMQILAEIAELKRMPVLAETLRRWQPQPDPVQQQLQQLEILKAQAEIQKLQSEIVLNQARAEEALSTAGKKHLDRIEQETGTAHARKIVEQQAQARGNASLEVTKALLKPVKEGERPPNIEAAIGHNALSEAMQDEKLFQEVPNPNQQ